MRHMVLAEYPLLCRPMTEETAQNNIHATMTNIKQIEMYSAPSGVMTQCRNLFMLYIHQRVRIYADFHCRHIP